MSIPALLTGISGYIATKLCASSDERKRVQPRWGSDGAPLGAWKTGMGWFVGVYFGGAQAISRESYNLNYTVGIDVTRMLPLLDTTRKTTELLVDNELLDKAERIAELIMSGRSLIANACNTALAGSWQDTKGGFHQNFETGTISPMKTPGPEWCQKATAEGRSQSGENFPIGVISMSFSGLIWWKHLDNLFNGV